MAPLEPGARAYSAFVLTDGTYDAQVLDAEDLLEGGVEVEVTIVGGEHRGATLKLRSPDWFGEALDLLGIPATIIVRDGRPRIIFEP